MRICIIGPGSVGLFLAAHLAQHEQVTLVVRNIAKSTRQYVRVIGLLECQAKVNISPHVVDADFVMVTTKSPQLETVMKSLKECKAPVVFWQNGLGINHLVETQLPGVPLIRALVWMGVMRTSPYITRCNGFSRIAIGSLQGETNLSSLQTTLRNAGLTTEIASHIDCAEWEKALWSIGVSGLCAITDERNGVIVDSPCLHEILVQLIHEAQAVARATGCDLDLVESIIKHTHTTATNVNSMLQDIQAARITEIDYLNGYVMRLGNQIGMNTPYNTTIYHLVKHIETRRVNAIN